MLHESRTRGSGCWETARASSSLGGEKEDSIVYLRALFKYMVREGQTQESEQTEVRICSVCFCGTEFAGDLTGLVLLSDRGVGGGKGNYN